MEKDARKSRPFLCKKGVLRGTVLRSAGQGRNGPLRRVRVEKGKNGKNRLPKGLQTRCRMVIFCPIWYKI